MIQVKNLSAKLGRRLILDQVSFNVAAGETVALVGANGAGKTTILRCLLGIVHYSGNIRINSIFLETDPIAAKSCIGYMPQVPAFFEESLEENLTFLARLRGVEPGEIYPLLERVGLLKHATRAVRVLSTGMRQRLSLAASLIGHPPILILDEPTASVDLKGQKEFIRLLQDLQSEGQTILLSSHRAEEVRALVDRLVVMDEGKVIAIGPMEEVAPTIWGDAVSLSDADEPPVFRARRVK